jgi:hypothetical protein
MSVRGGLGDGPTSRPDDPLGVRRLAPSWRFACSRGWRTYAAATDELTGLPNRRALYAEGHARLAVPQRGRHALLMLDLDKFRGSMTASAMTPRATTWPAPCPPTRSAPGASNVAWPFCTRPLPSQNKRVNYLAHAAAQASIVRW